MEISSTSVSEESVYAREMAEFHNELRSLPVPTISEDIDLTYEIGYLFHDGTIAYTNRRGDMKFSLIRSIAQPIPFLERIGMKFGVKYDDRNSYYGLTYRMACEMKRKWMETEFIKKLVFLHKDLHYFVSDKHNSTLLHIENGGYVEVYSDGEMIEHTNYQLLHPSFAPETFYFPLTKRGTTDVEYSYAVIPTIFSEQVYLKIQEINNLLRRVRREYEEIISEYA